MSSVYITSERPKDLEVNVLGTVYTINFKTPEEDVKLIDCGAYCDNSILTITVRWFEWDGMNLNDMLAYTAKCIRHEIVHAFLYQSGLDINSNNEWAKNEEMVDWIAIQLYKMSETSLGIEQKFYKQNKENVVVEP